MEKWNGQLEHRQPMAQTRGLFCMHVRLVCGWLSITAPVSLLAKSLTQPNFYVENHELQAFFRKRFEN